jgi:hypothetical protein
MASPLIRWLRARFDLAYDMADPTDIVAFIGAITIDNQVFDIHI